MSRRLDDAIPAKWTPRDGVEALIVCDTLLAELTPRFGRARAGLLELQSGLSGRPAGSGDPPGGGSGFSSTSVVERTATVERKTPERWRLDRLDELPPLLVVDMVPIIRSCDGRLSPLPPSPTAGQRLAWVSWATRLCVELHQLSGTQPRKVLRFHGHVDELHALVLSATADPQTPTVERAVQLATDLTDMWCRSCLRIGQRAGRSDRYADGLCRWCGDFTGAQGFLPTLDLLDAYHAGKRITETMVAAARQSLLDKPKKRRKRRK